MGTLTEYIWNHRLFPKNGLTTTAGEKLQIINPGENSHERENIFRNACIKIDGHTWSGNIIIHDKSSDWEEEIQCNSKETYENVILHVTGNDDIETMYKHGEYIPQLRLQFPQNIADEYKKANSGESILPCDSCLSSMSILKQHSFMSRLMIERIEEKSKRISKLHNNCGMIWEDTLFKLLARNFGFGIQNDIFEHWASVLSMNALGKHRNSLLQIEAIFFGQAGLLSEETIPEYYRKEAITLDYYKDLQREYKFLSNKFALKSIDGKSWGNGFATPHTRIARLASLYHKGNISLSAIVSCDTVTELRHLLQSEPEGYWRNHQQFGSTQTTGTAPQSNSKLDLLIINTVVPFLYLYGKRRKEPPLCEKAENHLHNIHSEENSITRKWSQKGIAMNCAADSQAIIQLQKAYCNKKNCKNCHFAYTYIKESIGA